MSVHESRKDYNRLSLGEGELDPDPIRQFHQWFEEATLSEIPEPNAMVLATASPDGRPSARIVLLRGYDERGFVFFTNYESRKGRKLEATPTRPWFSTGTIWSGKFGSKGRSCGAQPRNPTPTSRAARPAPGWVPGHRARAR